MSRAKTLRLVACNGEDINVESRPRDVDGRPLYWLSADCGMSTTELLALARAIVAMVGSGVDASVVQRELESMRERARRRR